MRFQRGDTPGILVAALGPAALMLLLVVGYDLWHHEGTPLLGALATAIAVGGGVLAALTRFIEHRRVPAALLALLLLDIGAVLVARAMGHDASVIASALKVLGALLFVALNAAVIFEVIDHGLLPLLDRRATRRADAP